MESVTKWSTIDENNGQASRREEEILQKRTSTELFRNEPPSWLTFQLCLRSIVPAIWRRLCIVSNGVLQELQLNSHTCN